MSQIGFWLEMNGPQILGRLTTSGSQGTLNINQFRIKYKQMLLTAQKNKQKKRVLFDLSDGYSMSIFLSVKSTLQDYFQVEIKELSEAVVEKCYVVIPDKAIGQMIQGIINLVGSPIPTYIRETMPHK